MHVGKFSCDVPLARIAFVIRYSCRFPTRAEHYSLPPVDGAATPAPQALALVDSSCPLPRARGSGGRQAGRPRDSLCREQPQPPTPFRNARRARSCRAAKGLPSWGESQAPASLCPSLCGISCQPGPGWKPSGSQDGTTCSSCLKPLGMGKSQAGPLSH